jgi:hypothetical protein
MLTFLLEWLLDVTLNLISYLRDQVLPPVLKVVEPNLYNFFGKVFRSAQLLDQINSEPFMRFILDVFQRDALLLNYDRCFICGFA